ncbi:MULTISPECIES: hypothetical protein [Agrobacterium]|jgi:hypothetical protein|uniref:Uncharacterized protein n=1 Tax=Agrobacterium salinitolerans TaxID=1183413 RepID=A0ABY3BHG9_9HYPH|nr:MULTISPECIES: hypothetical protein [Agrobacterium]MBG0512044.1 hypothetical protein [Agrobacterium leguminum]MBW9076230.1 hypothetical protein [Agrobacterium deltaense]TRA83231.1 hypothetical protein EXN23_25310 [Agrobacterium salinitolerans]
MPDESKYILSAAAALGGDLKKKKAGAFGVSYDSTAINLLKGLNSHRKPWDDLMYDPNDAKEVSAIRARIKTYVAANPNEKLPPAIAAFMERE